MNIWLLSWHPKPCRKNRSFPFKFSASQAGMKTRQTKISITTAKYSEHPNKQRHQPLPNKQANQAPDSSIYQRASKQPKRDDMTDAATSARSGVGAKRSCHHALLAKNSLIYPSKGPADHFTNQKGLIKATSLLRRRFAPKSLHWQP